MVLEKANSVSSLAFLRSLQAARTCINALVDDLKSHGLTEHPDPASVQISLTLDQQVDELFVPYLVGNAYIEREKKSLEELYSSLLFKFTIYHVSLSQAPQARNVAAHEKLVSQEEAADDFYGYSGKIWQRASRVGAGCVH